MSVAHVMGIPFEESVLQLAPAGAAIVTAAAIAGRARARPPPTMGTKGMIVRAPGEASADAPEREREGTHKDP